jgi:hypothetical protein
MKIKATTSNLTITVGGISNNTSPTDLGSTTGIVGNIGVQGFQGNQGNIGFQGTLGVVGVQGNQGIVGVQGNQGGRGNQGINGFDGPSGFAGGQGAQGNLGIGTQGLQGVSSGGGGLTVGQMVSFVPYYTGQTSPTTNVFDLGPTGNYDLFTVPAGKQLYLISQSLINTSGVSIQYSLGFKGVGGTFCRILPVSSANAGNTSTTSFPIIFNSGETIGMFVSNSGGTCRLTSFLIDSSPNILCIKKVNGWIAGDNTIYTCPIGKSAIGVYFSPYQLNTSGGAVQYFNGSTANATMNIYAVPSGQTVQAKYSATFFTTPTLRTPGNQLMSVNISLSSGESIIVNTTSNLDGQVCTFTLFEY